MLRPRISNILEDKHSTSIIILLYICGRKSKTEIYDMVSTNPRMPMKLDNLARNGIVTVTLENGSRPRSMVDLTPLGRTYAKGLCDLEMSVGGDLSDFLDAGGRRPWEDERLSRTSCCQLHAGPSPRTS